MKKDRLLSVIKQLKKPSFGVILAMILGLLFVGIISERFITQGTLFGYKVREVSKQKVDDDKRYACEKAPLEEASKAFGSEAELLGSAFGDRAEPLLISICSYRTKQKPHRTLTIVIRDTADNDAAEKALNETSESLKAETVSLGDGASYSDKARQLNVRKGKQIITVTVSEPRDHSQTENKKVVTDTAKVIIK